MKMKALVLLFLISLVSQVNFATSQVWYEGSLVLKTNEVLCGSLSIHHAYDMVTFKSGDQLKVYTADKIKSFFFYDIQSNINRKFISLTHNINSLMFNYLYEQVLYGEIQILRRVASMGSDIRNDRDGYRYYVRVGNRTVDFNKFRTEVYPYMIDNAESLLPYIKQNKLSPNNAAHIIQIVDYYNKGLKPGAVIARS